MLYSTDLTEIRRPYFVAWQKYREKTGLLTPLEEQLVSVIAAHPEYHALFEATAPDLDKIYHPELGETNPFLHLGFHIAIREQIATDRPEGMAALFQKLCNKQKDPLEAEHLMMEQLAHFLWLAQQNKQAFDNANYLLAIQKLVL